MQDVYRTLAEQLKKPSGELAIAMAEKMNELNELINHISIDALNPSEGDTILEVGMSNGFFVKNIFEKQSDIKYVGCDYSAKMVYEAKHINETLVKENKAEFIIADVIELPMGDKVFNKVLIVATLYYFEDLNKVFSELRRVMQDHAQLVISIRPRSVMEQFGVAEFSDHMFSQEELLEFLASHKFKVLNISEHKERDVQILEEDLPSSFILVVAEKE